MIPSSGLSKGAIAGIVIGVLALLAAIIVAVFFILRRRKSVQSGQNAPVTESTYIDAKSELAATPGAAQAELEAPENTATYITPPVELSSDKENTGPRHPEVHNISDQAHNSRIADIESEVHELEEKMASGRHLST